MKKIIFTILSFILLIPIVSASPLPDEVGVTADAVVVVNLQTDDIIYEKNLDKVEILASLTKVMTAYTVLDHVENLNEKITITEDDLAALWGFTCAGLEVGDRVSYLDLLYALNLVSGADAAQALALHVGGSKENFKNMMNEEAAKLELKHTHFEDSYGGDDNNVSTPREFSILLKAALQNETFKKVFGTNQYTLSNGLPVVNYTASFATYHGLDSSLLTGNKSGYTPEAGLLLASTATINGTPYMAIVMKCAENQKLTTHVLDTYKIYDYIAQHHYSRRTLLAKGTVLKKIEVEDSTISEYVVTVDKDINLMVSDEEFQTLDYDYHIVNVITPKNKVGDNLGYVDILINGQVVDTYGVYLKDEIFSYQEPSKIIVLVLIGLTFLILVLLCSNLLSRKPKHKFKK